jgi:hypothetical protein
LFKTLPAPERGEVTAPIPWVNPAPRRVNGFPLFRASF